MVRRQNYAPSATLIPMQGKTKEQGTPLATQYACSTCAIRYSVPKDARAVCPLCTEMKLVKQLREALTEAVAKTSHLTDTVNGLTAQVNRISAIQQALTVTNTEDRTFLKSVLYRFREDPLIVLQATHSSFGGGGVRDRFLVESRAGRGKAHESHTCTSPGGIAIVNYYLEATREGGAKGAMKILMRALGQELAA